MAETREERRARLLAQKPKKSSFTKDDEQQARASKRTPSKPPKTAAEKNRDKGSVTRDYRGTEGVIDDAVGNANRSLQDRDNP
jgi:hypothetical protein